MSYSVDLKSYLPPIYEGIVEMESLQDSLSEEIVDLYDRCMLAMADQFIQTCSENGIKYYEDVFHIIAQPSTETLEFRRLRILNRLRAKLPPYTRRYLVIMLDKLIGNSKYSMYVDWAQRTLNLEYSTDSESWYKEVEILITNVKPCNLVFIHIPLLYHPVYIQEQINIIKTTFNYALDGTWGVGEKTIAQCTNNLILGSWKLGQGTPFSSLGEEEVLKMGYTHSIQENTLIELANKIKEDIDHLVITDGTNTYTISSFSTFCSGATASVQYAVPSSCNLTAITNIKLLREDNSVIASADVYVQIRSDMLIKHSIPITEGIYSEL